MAGEYKQSKAKESVRIVNQDFINTAVPSYKGIKATWCFPFFNFTHISGSTLEFKRIWDFKAHLFISTRFSFNNSQASWMYEVQNEHIIISKLFNWKKVIFVNEVQYHSVLKRNTGVFVIDYSQVQFSSLNPVLHTTFHSLNMLNDFEYTNGFRVLKWSKLKKYEHLHYSFNPGIKFNPAQAK